MEMLYRLNMIRKSFGARAVLAIEELEIRPGCIHLLEGANGAGKSTLLQILAFLSAPTSGVVEFAGERVEWQDKALLGLRREATLVHQSPYLFDESVSANVSFGLRARRAGGEEQRHRVAEALEMVGLPGFEARRARELSGGEVKRVAMARALVTGPVVLLLDEPLANVDRKSAGILEMLISGLPANGTTVIMASHDPWQAGRLGAERICLVEGRIAMPPYGEEAGKSQRFCGLKIHNVALQSVARSSGIRVERDTGCTKAV